MQRKNSFVAVLFLLSLAGGMLLLLSAFFGGEGHLEALLKSAAVEGDPLRVLREAESAANQDLDRFHYFIELYGGSQRLIGRDVLVDMADPDYSVVKLSDGSLAFEHLGADPVDVTPHAQAVSAFADALEEEFELPLLYIQAPQKADPSKMPIGVTDYGNAYADRMLEVLAQEGVDAVDLRPAFFEALSKSEEPFFFCTDHHWTPEGGFTGYRILSEYLEEQYGLSFDPLHLDSGSYEKVVYEDFFLGSQGKRVGTLYAGVDDISLWKPTFPTDFTYTAPLYAIERTGPFEESLLFPERVAEKDYYNANPYTLYSGGDYNLARMTNHLNPDGPRILLIRDSYSCVLAPFLALDCSELITIDLRYFKDNLMDYIDWLDPDLVCVEYAASSTRLPELFQFFGAEEKPGYRY